jgi:hypothetical protein
MVLCSDKIRIRAAEDDRLMNLHESPLSLLFLTHVAESVIPRRRRMFSLLQAIGSMVIILASCLALTAQNVVLTGSLGGRVTDASGAVVPGASVVVRNLATGVEQRAETNHDGLYRFPVVMPGTYSVNANRKGFRDVQTLVRVLVGNTTSQDIRMQVGASADTVKVIGEAPLLRPEESSSSTVIDRSLIEDLPLNGRKYSNFVVLTPNTSYDGDTGLISIAGQQGGEDSGYANGNGSTYFSVDGSNATNNYFADIVGRNRIPYLFGEDSIQEFQVTVSPYTAIYGGGAGFVTAITRSGGNAFHGSAFYYNRNDVFEANDALDIAAGNPKPQDDLQQFGAAVGGPILRNRLWFFADYEQQLHNNPIAVINPALQTNPSNLGAFVLANFFPPSLTQAPPLPAPSGLLPVPNLDTQPQPRRSVLPGVPAANFEHHQRAELQFRNQIQNGQRLGDHPPAWTIRPPIEMASFSPSITTVQFARRRHP